MSLFYTKNIKELLQNAKDDEKGLKRTLSRSNLIMLGIGAIIGAGIFSITGTAAADHAGPAIVLSFVLSGIACVFAGLCYAEMAAMIPIAGSAYTFAYATIGELFAWIIGWDLILEYLFSASAVAASWSGYAQNILRDMGISLPYALSTSPFTFSEKTGWALSGAMMNFPAMLILGLLSVILVIGIKESARFNNVLVIVKVLVIVVFIILGISFINLDNWTPFIPENTGTWGDYGISGVMKASALIFFAYIGFDSVSTAAQEAKNPQKDMAAGILGSLAICTILYILFSLVLTGVTHYSTFSATNPLARQAPVAYAVDQMGESMVFLKYLVKLGAMAGLTSATLLMLLGQPRIFYSMSVDGLLPKVFGSVHPKFKTPYFSTVLTGVISILVVGIVPKDVLESLVSIGTLFAFIIVCAGVMYLRYTKPNEERPFKVPYVYVVGTLGIVTCLGQMLSLSLSIWLRLLAWLAVGLVIYFVYGRANAAKQRIKS
jgi:basic amino acid/polyamine antiporter, APA family